MEKMHFVTARKNASDRSAPDASLVVADSYTFKPMPPLDGGQGKEPEGTSVPSVCFLWILSFHKERKYHKKPGPSTV